MSKLSTRFGVPSLLLFLIIGMLAGSDGPGGIPFSNANMALLVGSVALCLILFDGGLQTDVRTLDRPILVRGILLATVGVVLTTVVMAAVAVYLLDMSWSQGLLLGAILSATDAAAVFSVLRSGGVGIPERLRSLIELESGSNDPTAVFLTVSLVALSLGTLHQPALLPVLYLYRIVGGGLVGLALAAGLAWLLDHVELEHEGLYPVLTLASVGAIFGIAERIDTSGFMAAYVAGLLLSTRQFVHRNSLLRFHAGLAWLMQIAMFLILGLLVFPSRLGGEAVPAVILSIALIFVARPIAVFVTLAGSSFGFRDKLLVSWVGLRGAAPIILAVFPMVAGLPASEHIFNTVFFAVVISVLVQAPTVGWVARRLGLAEPLAITQGAPIELSCTADTGLAITRLVVERGSEAEGHQLLRIGGPTRPLVIMLRRGGRLSVPTGGSRMQADDELFVLGDSSSVEEMRAAVSAPVRRREGSAGA